MHSASSSYTAFRQVCMSSTYVQICYQHHILPQLKISVQPASRGMPIDAVFSLRSMKVAHFCGFDLRPGERRKCIVSRWVAGWRREISRHHHSHLQQPLVALSPSAVITMRIAVKPRSGQSSVVTFPVAFYPLSSLSFQPVDRQPNSRANSFSDSVM